MSGFVRTVLGDIAPEELVPTYAREHLLTRPAGERVRDDPDLVLDDERRAATKLLSFRQAGGRALVEVSTAELGRHAAGPRRLAQRTGVHVVAATGHVCEHYWRGAFDLEATPEREFAGRLVRDLTEGMDGTDVRAGVIKVGSSLDRVTATEHQVIGAAAAAQRETGAPITTTPPPAPRPSSRSGPWRRLGPTSRTSASAISTGGSSGTTTWRWPAPGVFLGYDCVGKEQYQLDAERVRFIMRLAEEGHARQVLLAGDMARRRYLRAWGGGPGYPFILREFLPRLRAAGLPDADALVVANPARFVTWRAG
jgi:phosphotriesterase-related protein